MMARLSIFVSPKKQQAGSLKLKAHVRIQVQKADAEIVCGLVIFCLSSSSLPHAAPRQPQARSTRSLLATTVCSVILAQSRRAHFLDRIPKQVRVHLVNQLPCP
jgi:hypothetical protein